MHLIKAFNHFIIQDHDRYLTVTTTVCCMCMTADLGLSYSGALDNWQRWKVEILLQYRILRQRVITDTGDKK